MHPCLVKRAILNGTRWERICAAGDLALVDTNNLSPLPVCSGYHRAAPLGYIGEVDLKPMLCCFAIKGKNRCKNTALTICCFWLQTHRVELNAMTTPQLIDWLDGKMEPYEKLVPPDEAITEEF